QLQFKALCEFQLPRCNTPTDTADCQVRIIVEILCADMIDESFLEQSAREDPLRDTTQQSDEMVIVDVQVDSPTTQLAEITDVRRPVRGSNDAPERRCKQLPVSFFLNAFPNPAEFRKERKHLCNHQKATGLFSSFKHPTCR